MDIFVKCFEKKHFFTLKKNNNFFWFHFTVFKGLHYFWVKLCIFFLSCSLQPTINWFVSLKAISDRDHKTIHHPSMNHWFQYCDLIKVWWSVKGLHKNALYIFASDKNLALFKFIFDNPSNFEINRLIRFVASRMFLLSYSASLISFSSF